MSFTVPLPAVDATYGTAEQLDQRDQPLTHETAQQFEAVIVSLLLKQMRQSFGGESFIPSDNGDIVGGMFDLYLGQQISESGGLGLVQMLEQSMR